MSYISTPNYFRIWNSILPPSRIVSTKRGKLPIYFVTRTNCSLTTTIRGMDDGTYVVKQLPDEAYVNLFDFKWLPLYAKLAFGAHFSITFKLVLAQNGLLGSQVSTRTNLVITSASTTFIYEPINEVLLGQKHVWFTLYPGKMGDYDLQIVCKLPTTENSD